MSKPVAINKITLPDLPEVVLRKRLFQLLDHKRHYRITWISATAGSGKTTLAASYLTERHIPCLWYQIDERDSDLPTFFYYLGLAIRRALPYLHQPLPLLTLDKHENIERFTQQYFEDFSSRLTAPFFIVFDNYQTIPPASGFHGLFKKGLAMVSPDIHVLVLSRANPPPEMAGLRANNEMRIIGDEPLHLNLKEMAAIFERESGVRPSPDIIRQMHQKTRGWAAGLILMAKHIRPEGMAPEQGVEFVSSEVYDYFAGELFSGMDELLKSFLLISAHLPLMTASATRLLTGEARAGRLLSTLHRNHLFTERYSASETVYQYHPLFRDFLLARAKDTFDADEINRIRRKAAGQMEAAGRIEDAAELYAESGHHEAVRRLIHTHAASMIAQGRLEILRHWLDMIPKQIVSANPWLLFWLGMSFTPARAREARHCFEKAFDLFRPGQEGAGLYLCWSRIIDSIILEWDDFRALDRWIEWFGHHWPEEQAAFPLEIQARLAASWSGALIIRKPDHPEVTSWIEKALDLSRKSLDTTTRLKAGIWAVTYYMWQGDYHKALIFKEIADKLVPPDPGSPVTLLFRQWLDLSADIRSMTSPQKALTQALSLLEAADKRGAHQMDHILFPPAMFAALVLGDIQTAETLLKRFGSMPGDSRLQGQAIFHHFKGLFCLLQGRTNEALAQAETALKMVKKTGYVFYEALCHFQMAHVLQKTGQRRSAQRHLNRADELAVRTRSRMLRFMCLLKKAHLALESALGKKRSEGVVHLREAMKVGRNYDFVVMLWWWDRDMMVQLCSEALQEGIETDYVKRLIRIHRLTPATALNHLQDWPWAVKILTMGCFQIKIDEKPLRFKGRFPQKPLQLLQALIAYGGTDVPLESLIDALWYETDGDLASSAFSTTLNRLRKLLGNNEAVQLSQGRVSLNPNYCWVDALVFHNLLEKGDALGEYGQTDQAAKLYENALSLYRGVFLSGETPQGCNLAARERLKHRYLEATTKLGLWLEKAKKFKKAMAFYEKALSIDDLNELMYQRLMVCQLHLGRQADVARTYQQCQKRLSETLKTTPSPDTRAIYDQIHNCDLVDVL